MSNQGWVKFHRKLLDWEWYSDIPTKVLFIHLLLRANHEDQSWKGTLVKRGQLISGRKKLSEETGLSEQEIRTSLVKLRSTQEVTIKSTSKFSIFTIVKWDDYQVLEKQSTSKSTNEQPTINQQSTTNKNVKNDNNEKKNKIEASTDAQKEETKQINLLLEEFRRLSPGLNFGNKTERESCAWLLKTYGFEKTVRTIEFVLSIQHDKFAPRITTPFQLKTKMGELTAYFKKEESKSTVAFIS